MSAGETIRRMIWRGRLSPASLRIARQRAELGIECPSFPKTLKTRRGIDSAHQYYIARAAEELARLHAFRLHYPEAGRYDSYPDLIADFRHRAGTDDD